MKDVHRWVQPLRMRLIEIELLNLLLKNGENAASRVAGFEPVSERVREKIRFTVVRFLYAFKALSKNIGSWTMWKQDECET